MVNVKTTFAGTPSTNVSSNAALKRHASNALERSKIENTNYDMLIIGGGIAGTSTAYDAASRGLNVLLLEKSDFGSGTTAHPSRFAHGGLRYLQNAHFKLVYESLHEKNAIMKNAPHLARPLAFVYPIYSGFERAKVKAGMMLYDKLSGGQGGHRWLNKKELLTRVPSLNQEGLKGAYIYFDAQVELPERWCVENLEAGKQAAEKSGGSLTAVNYASVTNILTEDADTSKDVAKANLEATGVRFTDVLTGEEYTAKAKVIVNAAGPWINSVLDLTTKVDANGEKPVANLEKRVGGTKGSHILIKSFERQQEGPAGTGEKTTTIKDFTDTLFITSHQDGRALFVIPMPDKAGDRYMVGTTDEFYDGRLEDMTISDKELDYLIEEVNHNLPGANITRDDIINTFAGVRPLPFANHEDEGKISRMHEIEDHADAKDAKIARLMSLVGVKITPARQAGEEMVDAALSKYLQKDEHEKATSGLQGVKNVMGHTAHRVVQPFKTRTPSGISQSDTDNVPLPGGVGIDNLNEFKRNAVVQDLKQNNASNEWSQPDRNQRAELVDHLIDIYGSRYTEILDLMAEKPALAERLGNNPDVAAQVVFAVRNEYALNAQDVLVRRTKVGFNDEAGLDVVEQVSKLIGQELSWTQEQVVSDVEDYKDYVKTVRLPQ